MAVWIEEIKKSYKKLTDKQLLRLVREDAAYLRPEALEVLKEEIKSRGLDENLDTLIDEQTKESGDKISPEKSKKNPLLGWGIVFAIIAFLALSFHFVPEALMMFPKDHLTFSNTFITIGDIDAIVKRYNDASFVEKTSMDNDPFMRKLREKGLIRDTTSSDRKANK